MDGSDEQPVRKMRQRLRKERMITSLSYGRYIIFYQIRQCRFASPSVKNCSTFGTRIETSKKRAPRGIESHEELRGVTWNESPSEDDRRIVRKRVDECDDRSILWMRSIFDLQSLELFRIRERQFSAVPILACPFQALIRIQYHPQSWWNRVRSDGRRTKNVFAVAREIDDLSEDFIIRFECQTIIATHGVRYELKPAPQGKQFQIKSHDVPLSSVSMRFCGPSIGCTDGSVVITYKPICQSPDVHF